MRFRSTAVVLLICGAALAEPTVLPEARAKFRAGAALMADPDGARIEEAYRLFKEAYALSPSWKMLGNLGMSAMRLERHGEAIEVLERYLSEGGAEIEPVERAQIDRDLRTLKAGSGVLSVTLPEADGTLRVDDVRSRADGGKVSNAYAVMGRGPHRLVVALGRHALSVRINDRIATWEGEVGTSGASVQLVITDVATPSATASVEPARPPARRDPADHARHRTAGVVTAGLGGAMLLGGVATAILGQRKKIALDDACPQKACPEERRGDVDTLRTYQTATNLLLVAGAGVAVTGVVIVVSFGPPDDTSTTISASPGGFALRRRF